MIFPTSQMPSQSKFSQINHITRTNQIMLSNTAGSNGTKLELFTEELNTKKETLLVSFKMVEDRRFELLTSCVQNRHSTN